MAVNRLNRRASMPQKQHQATLTLQIQLFLCAYVVAKLCSRPSASPHGALFILFEPNIVQEPTQQTTAVLKRKTWHGFSKMQGIVVQTTRTNYRRQCTNHWPKDEISVPTNWRWRLTVGVLLFRLFLFNLWSCVNDRARSEFHDNNFATISVC